MEKRYGSLRLLSAVQRLAAFLIIMLSFTIGLVFFGLVFMENAITQGAPLVDPLFLAIIAAVGTVSIISFGLYLALSLLGASDRNLLEMDIEENTRMTATRLPRPTPVPPAARPAAPRARPTRPPRRP